MQKAFPRSRKLPVNTVESTQLMAISILLQRHSFERCMQNVMHQWQCSHKFTYPCSAAENPKISLAGMTRTHEESGKTQQRVEPCFREVSHLEGQGVVE